MEYQLRVQEQLRAQTDRMRATQRQMEREQAKKDTLIQKEKERQATRQWWKTPYSSSTTAWVHSGGAKRTSSGEVRPWANTLEESMVVQPANSTINLNSTEEEIEVLLLDQDLGDEELEMEERMDTAPPPPTQEHDRDGENKNKASKGPRRT